MSDLILYTTENGQSRIQLRADNDTVWLTQLKMAELFQTTKQNLAKHLKAIFTDEELNLDSVVNYWLTTAADDKLALRPTIKESLTVQNEYALKIAADEFSAVHTPRCSTQRVEHLQNKRS